jgi:Ca-activated chloride channel family protein
LGAPWAMAALLWLGGSALIAWSPPAHKLALAQQKPPTASIALPTRGELQQFRVQITSPTRDDDVAGRVRVRAEVAADRPAAVSAVDFFVDGRLMFSDAKAPYELLWNSGRPAEHVIEVRAYGPGRQVVSDSLSTRYIVPSELGGYVARVERVEVHVRVEDEEALVGVPDAGTFEVLENGVLQPVIEVERVADLPLSVGILVDHSGSMLEHLETALDAAGAFVDGLLTHPQDKAFVLGFADIPIVFQEFTNDSERLAQSIDLIDAGRYTALYDAVVAAATRFEGSSGRRAVILLTDGADQGSEHRFREAIAAAQRADIALYPVAVELSPRFPRQHWILNELANETGGLLFSLGRRTDAREIYEAIAADVRSQYRVSYAPRNPGGEGEWRDLEVRLRGDERQKNKVRSRPGYFAQ